MYTEDVGLKKFQVYKEASLNYNIKFNYKVNVYLLSCVTIREIG